MTFGQRYYNGNVDICAVGILDADVAVAGLVKKMVAVDGCRPGRVTR
jgi:hypothetical protein